MNELHIIEPTLVDQTGHCHAFVSSLYEGNADFNYSLHVWLNHRGRKTFSEIKMSVHPHFFRRIRNLQMFFCLKRLIRDQKTILIPTASYLHVRILSHLLRHRKAEKPIFLYFHHFKPTDNKIRHLKKIAQRNFPIVILTTTVPLLNIFKQCGFKHCEWMPFPGHRIPQSLNESEVCEKIVYAGAARMDKGFPEVVNFMEYLVEREQELTVELQISPSHKGCYDRPSEEALSRLKNLNYKKLITHEKTLDWKVYLNLFANAVALLLYDAENYKNKFSGVALDAFCSGCPVIGMKHTWTGDMIERFQAGVALTDRSPQSVFAALQTIRSDYPCFHENAKNAGNVLSQEHHPRHFFLLLNRYSTQEFHHE